MSRKAEQNRVVHKEDGLAVEQTSIYDDSLLPPAEELAKLKELDPNAIEWIKERTEIEQDARIQFNKDKIRLMDKDMSHIFIQNIVCIAVAFFIILSAMGISAYFICRGLKIEGTIFGGSSLVIAAMIFIRWSKNSKDDKG